MSYAVRIEAFEGPLDLLLYLIRKNEVDVYDIPIAAITHQYLDYIEVMQMLDLEVAGDFLVMAATLMQIKARLLLPSPETEEEEDPRLELVRQLEEYRLYKQAAEELKDREETYSHYYLREGGPGPVDLPESEEPLLDVSLFALIKAFHEALERVKAEGRYEVTTPDIKVADQIEFLRERLRAGERISFRDLLAELTSRLAMVVTLVATLELARLGELSIDHPDLYGDIYLVPRTPTVTFAAETPE